MYKLHDLLFYFFNFLEAVLILNNIVIIHVDPRTKSMFVCYILPCYTRRTLII